MSKNPGFSCGSDHCLAVLRRVGAKKQVPGVPQISFRRRAGIWKCSKSYEELLLIGSVTCCILLLLLDINALDVTCRNSGAGEVTRVVK